MRILHIARSFLGRAQDSLRDGTRNTRAFPPPIRCGKWPPSEAIRSRGSTRPKSGSCCATQERRSSKRSIISRTMARHGSSRVPGRSPRFCMWTPSSAPADGREWESCGPFGAWGQGVHGRRKSGSLAVARRPRNRPVSVADDPALDACTVRPERACRTVRLPADPRRRCI